jgi:hypothetical protein
MRPDVPPIAIWIDGMLSTATLYANEKACPAYAEISFPP